MATEQATFAARWGSIVQERQRTLSPFFPRPSALPTNIIESRAKRARGRLLAVNRQRRGPRQGSQPWRWTATCRIASPKGDASGMTMRNRG